jgi:hypothetical protein
MKQWNKILLETIIRDNLFEQPESELKTSKIIPWLGLSGESKVRKAKQNLNITKPVVEGGFTVKNRGVVSKPQIIQTIQDSKTYGIGSRFDVSDMLYIISNDKRESENISIRDVIILNQNDFELTKIRNQVSTEYSSLYDAIPLKVKREYNLTDVRVLAWPFGGIGNAKVLFSEDIEKLKSSIEKLQQTINIIKTTPEASILKQRIEDLEQQLKNIKTQPNKFDTITDIDKENSNIDSVAKSVSNTSNTEDIAQLQRDIIKMINNNPQIYPSDTEFKRVFDLFTKTYKDDGDWGTNMSDMIELINQGLGDGNSRSNISKSTYNKIIKYQTNKI